MRANFEEPGPDNLTQLRSIGYLINPDTDVSLYQLPNQRNPHLDHKADIL
jgi:hypothetical protein